MRYAILLPPLLALLAACGGDGEPASTSSPAAATERPAATRGATPSPTPAPDLLAFIREGDIWLINADGSGERRLTRLGNVQSFSWISPDEIDVITGEDRSGHFLVALDGNVRELPFPGASSSDAGFTVVWARGSWSRDGSLFAVPLEQQLVVFDRSGAEFARLQAGPPIVPNPDKAEAECGGSLLSGDPDRLIFGPPAFSPDGRRVLVAVNCASASGAYQLYSGIYDVTLDGSINRSLGGPGLKVSEPQALSTNFRLAEEFLAPRFSPDGAYVAQMSMGGFSLCPVVRGLAVAMSDGTDARTLAPSALTELQGDLFGGMIDYDWSPAGDSIVASFDVSICQVAGPLEPGFTGLYLLKADGTGEEKLLDGAVSSVAWSQSGRFIAFVPGKYFGESELADTITLIDLATNEVSELAPGTQPAWQPLP